MTSSMEEQLKELYRDKEVLSSAFPGLDAKEIVELARSVQTQLDSLIQDQIDALLSERQTLADAFPGMSLAQIIDLAKKGQAAQYVPPIDPIADSMEHQLKSLYAEREELETAFPGRSASSIVTEIQEKVRLLEQFYARIG